MKILPKLFLTALLLVNFSCEVSAGTTFTHLSKSVEIVDMDKWLKERDKAIEYDKKVKGAYIYCGSQVMTERGDLSTLRTLATDLIEVQQP